MAVLSNFKDILSLTKTYKPINVSIAFPNNEHILHSLEHAVKEGIINAHVVGNKEVIEKIALENNIDLNKFTTYFKSDEECLPFSVELVKNGTCNVLMKGDNSTASIMTEVLKKDNGLRTEKSISHIYVLKVPTYNKLLLITDTGMNIAPNLETKTKILHNAIYLANCLGISKPKVAVLSAVEKPTPKMHSTIDAEAIANNPEFKNIAIVEGPLAFDNAISEEAAKLKHINSNIAGDVDILLVPNIESGNILAKGLIYLANAEAAGIILGAKIPVILTSRADSTHSKLLSMALASIVLNKGN